MDLNTISFAEFVESEMRRQGYSERTLADLARLSFRAIGDARSGRLEEGLRLGTFTRKKLIGVTRSTHRLLIGLGADVDHWMDRLGLYSTLASIRIPDRNLFNQTPLLQRIAHVTDRPVSAGSIQKVFEKATIAQNALGDVFTVQTILSLLLQELENQVDQ
jgi:hypothetical protein